MRGHQGVPSLLSFRQAPVEIGISLVEVGCIAGRDLGELPGDRLRNPPPVGPGPASNGGCQAGARPMALVIWPGGISRIRTVREASRYPRAPGWTAALRLCRTSGGSQPASRSRPIARAGLPVEAAGCQRRLDEVGVLYLARNRFHIHPIAADLARQRRQIFDRCDDGDGCGSRAIHRANGSANQKQQRRDEGSPARSERVRGMCANREEELNEEVIRITPSA